MSAIASASWLRRPEVMADEDVAPKPPIPSTYLGDAVYASFDEFRLSSRSGGHKDGGNADLRDPVRRAVARVGSTRERCRGGGR